MERIGRRSLLAAALWAAVALPSCLPHDTRPEPGSVTMTVSGVGALLEGHGSLTTSDGWTLSYNRFLISIGSVSLEGIDCTPYYEADYRRVLDMQVQGPQRVGVSYGLGGCFFDFRLSGPNSDAVLGEGVTTADRIQMGTAGSDPYATNRGVSLYVAGQASKGDVTKRFAWEFRQRVRYEGCPPRTAAEDAPTFELAGGDAQSAAIFVRGETLFFDTLEPDFATTPRFDVMADADDSTGNGDGEVTLEELGAVQLADIGSPARYDSSQRGGTANWQTLEDFVYGGLFPLVVQYGTGNCGTQFGDSRR